MEFTKKTSGSAEFEDYHSTAKTYDELRVPVGLESLDKALELASQRLYRKGEKITQASRRWMWYWKLYKCSQRQGGLLHWTGIQ